MNKSQFLVDNSNYSSIYMSYVLKYNNTNTGVYSLLFASEEKNHLYITGDQAIRYVNIDFGDLRIKNLLPNEKGQIFLDISDWLRANIGKTIPIYIYIYYESVSEFVAYNVVVLKGLRYDRLAQNTQIPQNYQCGMQALSGWQYDADRSLSAALPPITIIVPFNEDGTYNKFRSVQTLDFVWYRSHLPLTGLRLMTPSGVIGNNTNNYSPFSISVSSMQTHGFRNSTMYLGTSIYNKNDLRPLQYSKKYICVRWQSPYICPLYFSSVSGTTSNFSRYYEPLYCQAFFEVLSDETDTEITNYENTASYMPYSVGLTRKIKIGIPNITAYDYAYYSQLFLSADISIWENDIITSSSLGLFSPAKIAKSKFTMPKNGNSTYNFEATLIIEEND